MTAESILDEIRPLGSEGYVRILRNHGIEGPCLGVKIEELKKIQKRVKMDYRLALELYDTGIYDAMYLAGLIADDARMTRQDLQRWLDGANMALAAITVAWVAAGSPHAREVAREWIESDSERVAVAGWATWSSLVSITPDARLDIGELEALLRRVEREIHAAPNRVRYQMNSFVISVGSYVAALTDLAIEVGNSIGKVTVDMGKTECQVPFAPDYIRRVEQRGSIGKKRKTAKC